MLQINGFAFCVRAVKRINFRYLIQKWKNSLILCCRYNEHKTIDMLWPAYEYF